MTVNVRDSNFDQFQGAHGERFLRGTNQMSHGEKVRHLLTEGTKDRLNLMVHQSLKLSYLLYIPL